MNERGRAEERAANQEMQAGKKGGAVNVGARGEGAEECCGGEEDLSGGFQERAGGVARGALPEGGLAGVWEAVDDRRGALGAEGIGGDAVDDVAAFLAEEGGIFGDGGSDASH